LIPDRTAPSRALTPVRAHPATISGRKRYNNPFIGLITLNYETFTVDANPGQTLFVFRAEPGGDDEHSLLLLAEIAGGGQPGPTRRSCRFSRNTSGYSLSICVGKDVRPGASYDRSSSLQA
jgi:MmyB-like transcription regulator ligand binding domain